MSIFKRWRGNGPEARTLRSDTSLPFEMPVMTPTDAVRPSVGPSTPSGASTANQEDRAFAPHCDARILHAPGECWACDLYPDWQDLREKWLIAFTGHEPAEKRHGDYLIGKQLPCPADFNRPPDSPSDHRQWGPNQAQGARRG